MERLRFHCPRLLNLASINLNYSSILILLFLISTAAAQDSTHSDSTDTPADSLPESDDDGPVATQLPGLTLRSALATGARPEGGEAIIFEDSVPETEEPDQGEEGGDAAAPTTIMSQPVGGTGNNDKSTEITTQEILEVNTSPTNGGEDEDPVDNVEAAVEAFMAENASQVDQPGKGSDQSPVLSVSDGPQVVHVRDGGVDLQTQLYIISGVFGGIVLLLILLVLALALSLVRLKEQIVGDGDRYSAGGGRIKQTNQQIYGYENGAYNGAAPEPERTTAACASTLSKYIVSVQHEGGMRERSVDGEDELEQMGYSVYNGSGSNRNREDAYKVEENGGDSPEAIPMSSLRQAASVGAGKPVLKYEEGVVPLDGGRSGDRRSATRDRYN